MTPRAGPSGSQRYPAIGWPSRPSKRNSDLVLIEPPPWGRGDGDHYPGIESTLTVPVTNGSEVTDPSRLAEFDSLDPFLSESHSVSVADDRSSPRREGAHVSRYRLRIECARRTQRGRRRPAGLRGAMEADGRQGHRDLPDELPGRDRARRRCPAGDRAGGPRAGSPPAATCCTSSTAATRAASPTRPRRRLDFIDAFFLVDHCVALLGAVDAMRYELPDKPMFLAQYSPRWTRGRRRRSAGSAVPASSSWAVHRRDDLRRGARPPASRRSTATAGCCARSTPLRRTGPPLTSPQMQVLVKSSMVMDIEEHNALLGGLIERLAAGRATTGSGCTSPGTSATPPGPSCSTVDRGVRRGRRRRRPLHGLPAHLDRRLRGRRAGRRARALVLGPQRDRPVRDPRPERRRLGRLPAALDRGERRGRAWSC